jgi:DNA mismatch endonuclease, patch repair protein
LKNKNDQHTLIQRTKIMRSIRSTGSAIENQISNELWKKGFRFRRNVRNLYGKPDIAIKKYKIVIFIDSCFWHYCPLHGKIPKTNLNYWQKKLTRNKERDKNVTEYYLNKGWHLLRIWEHDYKNDPVGTIETIIDFINQYKEIKGE